MRALADLRSEWDEEIEAAARYPTTASARRRIARSGSSGSGRSSSCYVAGCEDESPACRGSALLSLELLSRDAPGAVNQERSLLHELASHDPNNAVRRLAVMCLKNGSPQSDTIRLLAGLADTDDEDRELREAAAACLRGLTRKSRER